MEKQKRWQFYLILTVIVLTLYNILPTIFYYTKPLKDPITAPRAETVARQIVDRINDLENDSKAWLGSFCHLLGIKPASIEIKKNDPRLFEVAFKSERDASLFNRFLPRAGNLIPFVPAQLELYPPSDPTKSLVIRKIGVPLNPEEINSLFHFASKNEDNGKVSSLYRDIVYDRTTHLALALAARVKPLLPSLQSCRIPRIPATMTWLSSSPKRLWMSKMR